MALPLVELYINNQKVFFEKEPNIAITYSHTDLHNPTVVKNSYTKTVTIEGTPENNRIFNNFYDMRRINSGNIFNPSRKETFTLYKNGEPMETGYVKLDKVNKSKGKITYSVTLYGGLGQFLYNLQYNEAGEQLKLSDLDYGLDLNMVVNRNTIKDAWRYVTGINKNVDNAAVYDFINFAPCYNGLPSDFTSDKVAIDVESFKLNNPRLYEQFKKPEDADTVDGWIVAELAKEYDEWQMKDLRSYLQRPVVRFKNIIQSCCNPDNNGGYIVDLDSEFFNETNPYYENAWMTLPMIQQMEMTEGTVFSITGDTFELPKDTQGYIRLSVDTVLTADADTDKDKLYTGLRRNVKSTYTHLYNKAFTVQLVVYNANDTIIATSPCNAFYSDITGATDFDFQSLGNATVKKNIGQFNRQSDGTYVFNSTSFNLSTNTFHFESGIYCKLIYKDYVLDLRSNGYDINVLFENDSTDGVISTSSYNFNNETIEHRGELGYYLTKQMLLNTEKTPCDYFLTYLKQFNLHIWKDRFEKKIYVRKRKNYFTGEIKDIEHLVDIDNNVSIIPMNFETKWLELSNEMVESGTSDKYIQEFGVNYGIQRIDTNYNFDATSKSLIENNAFKSTIQIRRKSKYNIDIYQSYEDDDVYYPPFMLDGIQPLYFNSEGDTAEGDYIAPKTSQQHINWWEQKYYDFLPKPLFADDENSAQDGENVLLFYNGKVETKDLIGKSLDFQITDDIPQFAKLNDGEPCWIWTMDWDVAERNLGYLPSFSRYITNENGWVTYSWDFGTPRSVYLPEISIDNTSNIYTQYWKSYLQDQYNVNTRRVECYVLLKEFMIEDWLQSFYYFDGRYWVLNKVTDYNPLSNGTTKCEFISINELNNYLI